MVARNPAAVAAERLARADIPGLTVGVAGMGPARRGQQERGEERGPVQAFAHGQSAAQFALVSGPSQRPSPQQRAVWPGMQATGSPPGPPPPPPGPGPAAAT